jgi:hypothetical protein
MSSTRFYIFISLVTDRETTCAPRSLLDFSASDLGAQVQACRKMNRLGARLTGVVNDQSRAIDGD